VLVTRRSLVTPLREMAAQALDQSISGDPPVIRCHDRPV